MSNFMTYRVRYCEWQTFTINLSARSAAEACELAHQIRSHVGQEPFEETDGGIEHFAGGCLGETSNRFNRRSAVAHQKYAKRAGAAQTPAARRYKSRKSYCKAVSYLYRQVLPILVNNRQEIPDSLWRV